MSEFTATSSPSIATRLPAEVSVYAACAGLALTTCLSWLSIDLGGVFGGAPEAGAEAGQVAAVAGMLRQIEVMTSIGGLRLIEGKLALLAALVAAGLTWGEASGLLRTGRRALRLGALAAAGVGALAVLFAFTRAGAPLGLSFGIFAAALAAGAAVTIAVRRVQALPATSS